MMTILERKLLLAIADTVIMMENPKYSYLVERSVADLLYAKENLLLEQNPASALTQEQ